MRRLHFKDGDSGLDVRRLDIHRKPPRKTGAQSLFEGGEIFGGAVGGDDDLLVRLIEVVENVEKRLLGRLFPAYELDIVDHQHIAGAVFFTEAVALLVVAAPDDADELVDHGLRTDIDHPGLRGVFEEVIAYRLEKVCLAEPDAAVDEQRIVFPARVFRHRLRRGERELVGLAFHESVEGVVCAEGRGALFALPLFGVLDDESRLGDGVALTREIFVRLFADGDLNIRYKGIEGRHHSLYGVEIAGLHRLFRGGGQRGEHKSVVHKTDGLELFYPNLVAYRLHALLQLVFNIVPKFFFADHGRPNYNKTT